MNLIEIFLIGVGLSMDALAVAIASGLAAGRVRASQAALMAVFFGGFQAIMPLIGWLGGWQFAQRIAWVSTVDHWVAGGALWIIGGKMLYEAVKHQPDADAIKNPFSMKTLFIMAVATSVDALAVGIGFGVSQIPIVIPVIRIGSTTFALSFGGVYLGKRFGAALESQAEILGALVLIGIGIKIVIEHSLGVA